MTIDHPPMWTLSYLFLPAFPINSVSASGNGKSIQIYDGRKSLADGKIDTKPMAVEKVQSREESGGGEIIYFRDSDDEMPDSDEDPDDDLDI